MKTSYLKQLIKQAYIKGCYANKNLAYKATLAEVEQQAEDYANIDLDFLDLIDKDEVI